MTGKNRLGSHFRCKLSWIDPSVLISFQSSLLKEVGQFIKRGEGAGQKGSSSWASQHVMYLVCQVVEYRATGTGACEDPFWLVTEYSRYIIREACFW